LWAYLMIPSSTSFAHTDNTETGTITINSFVA
jgi:hypothetical protein